MGWMYHWLLSLALFSALLVLEHHYPFETPHVDKAQRIFVLSLVRLKLGVKAIIFQEGIFNVQSALNWTFKTFYPQVMRSSTCTAVSSRFLFKPFYFAECFFATGEVGAEPQNNKEEGNWTKWFMQRIRLEFKRILFIFFESCNESSDLSIFTNFWSNS